MKKITSISTLILLLAAGVACENRECNNTNSVFETSPIGSKEYNAELQNEIRKDGSDKVRFWFDKYEKKADQEYITVKVEGETFCAQSDVKVLDWTKVEDLRRTESGYRGAELVGFEMELENESFVYKDIDDIAD